MYILILSLTAADEEKQAEQESEERSETITGETQADQELKKPRVKMKCMPKISKFEEVLTEVDRTQKVKERIRYVFETMGLKDLSIKEQEQIVEYAAALIGQPCGAFNTLMTDKMSLMRLSQFINNFVHEYDASTNVKVVEFLTELQKIILNDDEINRL